MKAQPTTVSGFVAPAPPKPGPKVKDDSEHIAFIEAYMLANPNCTVSEAAQLRYKYVKHSEQSKESFVRRMRNKVSR